MARQRSRRYPDIPASPARVGVAARCVLIAALGLGLTACAGPPTDPPTATPTPSATPSRTPTVVPSPVPTPAPVEAPHLARSTPVRLVIPAIGVDTELMALGLQADGAMEVPPEGFPAGWYTGAPTPGELGPAIIAGHVDWTGPGVFYKLHSLVPDDEVSVTREDGSAAVFRVASVQQFPKDEFPTALVYGNLDHAGLRLITCGGTWNPRTRHYEDNLVVFADFVPPIP